MTTSAASSVHNVSVLPPVNAAPVEDPFRDPPAQPLTEGPAKPVSPPRSSLDRSNEKAIRASLDKGKKPADHPEAGVQANTSPRFGLVEELSSELSAHLEKLAGSSAQAKSDEAPKYRTRPPNEKTFEKWGIGSKPKDFSQQYRRAWELDPAQRADLIGFLAGAIQEKGKASFPDGMTMEKAIEVCTTLLDVSMGKHPEKDEQAFHAEQKEWNSKSHDYHKPLQWLSSDTRPATQARRAYKAYQRKGVRSEYIPAFNTYMDLMRLPQEQLSKDLRRMVAKPFLKDIRLSLIRPHENDAIVGRMKGHRMAAFDSGTCDSIPERKNIDDVVHYDELIAFAQEGWELYPPDENQGYRNILKKPDGTIHDIDDLLRPEPLVLRDENPFSDKNLLVGTAAEAGAAETTEDARETKEEIS